MEVNKILDEDVKITERIKIICEQTEEIGQGTITMLEERLEMMPTWRASCK